MISNRLSIDVDKKTAIMFTNRPDQIDHSLNLILETKIISLLRNGTVYKGWHYAVCLPLYETNDEVRAGLKATQIAIIL